MAGLGHSVTWLCVGWTAGPTEPVRPGPVSVSRAGGDTSASYSSATPAVRSTASVSMDPASASRDGTAATVRWRVALMGVAGTESVARWGQSGAVDVRTVGGERTVRGDRRLTVRTR